jgi:anti-sigma factor RsiW
MTQKCDEIFRLMSEYVDGELPPGTCALVGAHLDSCLPCRSLHDSLRRTVEACREFRSGEAPGSMAAVIQDELRAAFRKAVAARKVADSSDQPR